MNDGFSRHSAPSIGAGDALGEDPVFGEVGPPDVTEIETFYRFAACDAPFHLVVSLNTGG